MAAMTLIWSDGMLKPKWSPFRVLNIIQELRGVQFLCCHTATEEQARGLIAHQNLRQQPEEIVKEMLAHTLPDVLVVASMVVAIAMLQTDGHYSYITA